MVFHFILTDELVFAVPIEDDGIFIATKAGVVNEIGLLAMEKLPELSKALMV